MTGTLSITPIPTVPKAPAAAATFNSRYTEITTGVSGHYNGTAARHLVGELDSPITDDHVTVPLLTVAATDQHTRNLQFLTLIGQMVDPTTTAIDAFAKVAQLVASGVNMKSLGSAITGRTPLATASTTVSRGLNAEAAFGSLTAFGFGTQNATEFKARPVSGQTVPVMVVENQAGTQTKWNVDGSGNTFQAANATIQGVVLAGSGAVAITTAAGFVDATKIAGTIPAAQQPAHTGDVTTPVNSVVTTVVLVGGKAAANVAAATTKVEGSSSLGVASAMAQFNASGGMTFQGLVSGTTFSGAFTGNVTGNVSGNAGTATTVLASGISGTIQASQIDVAIARAANVPNLTGGNASGTGAGASGLWGINISGNAATATSAVSVPVGTITNAMIAPNTIDGGAKLLVNSVDPSKLTVGALMPRTGTDLWVHINSFTKFNNTGQFINYQGEDMNLGPGGAFGSFVPTSPSQYRYVLIMVNGAGAAYPKGGVPVGGSFANATLPNADPDTTPLGYVSLQTGQTIIGVGDIVNAREMVSDYTGTGSGTTGAAHNHVHGRDEVRVVSTGFDEGFVRQTDTAGMSVIISAMHYRNTSGVVVMRQEFTFSPPITIPITYERIDLIYFDPGLADYAYLAGVENVTVPYPVASGNAIALGYLHTRPLMTSFSSSFSSTNGWIEDARAWLRSGGVASIPVVVNDGGTGAQLFTKGFVYSDGSLGGKAPLFTQPATNDALHGLGFAPILSGVTGGTQVDSLRVGGGQIQNNTILLNRITGTHAINPTRQTQAPGQAVTLLVDNPTIGTANASAIFIGNVTIGQNAMPTAALDVTGNAVISGTLSSGTFSPSNITVAAGGAINAPAINATGVATGKVTANNGLVATGGGLDVTGTALLKSGATVTGAITATTGISTSGTGTLDIAGTGIVRGTFQSLGLITASAGITAPGQAIGAGALNGGTIAGSTGTFSGLITANAGLSAPGQAIAAGAFNGGSFSGTSGVMSGNWSMARLDATTVASSGPVSGTTATFVGSIDSQGGSAGYILRDTVLGTGQYMIVQRTNNQVIYSDTQGANYWVVNPANGVVLAQPAAITMGNNGAYSTTAVAGYPPAQTRRSKPDGMVTMFFNVTIGLGAGSGMPANGQIASMNTAHQPTTTVWFLCPALNAPAPAYMCFITAGQPWVQAQSAIPQNAFLNCNVSWLP